MVLSLLKLCLIKGKVVNYLLLCGENEAVATNQARKSMLHNKSQVSYIALLGRVIGFSEYQEISSELLTGIAGLRLFFHYDLCVISQQVKYWPSFVRAWKLSRVEIGQQLGGRLRGNSIALDYTQNSKKIKVQKRQSHMTFPPCCLQHCGTSSSVAIT